MNAFLDWAWDLTPTQAVAALLGANLLTFAASVLLGDLTTRLLARRRVTAPAAPLTRRETACVAAGVLVNTLVTVLGWILWKAGWLVIRREAGWRILLDFAALLVLMDLGMYLLHRLAHAPPFFAIHRLHHEHHRVRALTLFVVHPLETLGFGLLWLLVVVAYGPSWTALVLYMTANLLAGTLGHVGVEPFPSWWPRVPILREVGTSTFHAQHHNDADHNFGFYTLVWDRLLGTLAPGYDAGFGRPLADTANTELAAKEPARL
jgi:sterol desaturase/sphingolipid hydroxylase (fatty acid hydroxylase superfamily)